MKKILLVCDLGMSTSLVVKRMQEAAARRDLDIEIAAKGIQEFKTAIATYDCALLGPQIAYKLVECQQVAGPLNKRVETINMMDYGMVNGEKILDHALRLVA